MAKIVNLSGGLNNRIDPTKLDENVQAVYIVNADVASGSVRNVPGPTPLGDSIQYTRNSGYVFFTRYDSEKEPEIIRQSGDVINEPQDDSTYPPIPARVEMDLTKLPSSGLTENIGHRGTSTNGVGNRDGRFIGSWKMIAESTATGDQGGGVTRGLRRGEAYFTTNGQFVYQFNPDSAEGPYIDRTQNPENIVSFQAGGGLTFVVKTQGSTFNILYNFPGTIIRSDAPGRQGWSYGLRLEPNIQNGRDISKLLPFLGGADSTVEVWIGHPNTHWTTIPQTILSGRDTLWISYITFDDQNNAHFSKPRVIRSADMPAINVPPALSAITKLAPLTLSAEGLPEGTTRVSGYLYLTRNLLTLLTGESVSNVLQIRGSIASNGDIRFLVVAVSGSADVQSIIGQDAPAFRIVVPTGLPTSGSGPTSRSPANFVGTRTFEAASVVSGLSAGLAGNSVVIYGEGYNGVTVPASDTDPTYNFSVSSTELQRANNPARLDFRLEGPHPNPPTVSNGAYNSLRDTFTNPEDTTDSDNPIPWSLNADIQVGKETWRTIVVINENGTLTFGTPTKIFDGQIQNLEGATESAIRMPPTGKPSLDRPINIIVGEDVNKVLTATASFHRKDGRWYFGDSDRDYVEYKNELFYTQEVGVPEYITEDNDEVAIGIPRPDFEEANISVTGSNVPATWNPVLRQIDIGPEVLSNNSPLNPFENIQPFQVVLEPFEEFDQTRIIRTFDTNVGGHEIYNSVIRLIEPPRTVDNANITSLDIEHLEIILDVGTSDATLISVGNVNCSNFEFRVWYGSGGGGHGRPTPIARINREQYYNMELKGGSYRRPIWILGNKIDARPTARDNNRTVTFNRLPRPVPPGRTHSIDWSEYKAGTGSARNIFYKLGAFIGDQLIRVYDFDISTNARDVQFIVSENPNEADSGGWRYKLYRRFGSTFNEVIDFGPNSTPGYRNFVAVDTDTNVDPNNAGTRPAITAEGSPPAIINSTTQYAITNVNEETGLESVPTVIDVEPLDNANAFIEINNIPVETDPRVETRYVYKIDSLYPQWGFIGKIPPTITKFEDNVNFTQSNIYVYNRVQENTPPPIPEFTSYTTGVRQAGQWDGTRFSPPVGWSRERPTGDEAGEFVYRSRVRLNSTTSEGTTTFTAAYSIPEQINPEGLLIRVGESLTSARNWEPESNLRFLTLYSNTLFGVDNNVLWFSRYGLPHYWPRENFFEFEDPITGLLSIQQGLLVFTQFKTYILIGSTLQDFAVGLVSAEQGCLNHKTAVFVKGMPLWISDDGIVSYVNGRANVISRNFLSEEGTHEINWAGVKNAVYWKDIYHVLLGEGNAPNGAQDIQEDFNNKILCLDLRYSNPKVYMCDGLNEATLDLETPERIGRFDDNKLYMVTTRNRDSRLYELMSDTQYLNSEWRSAHLVDGDLGKRKAYERIYISYKGRIEVTPIIDNIPQDPISFPNSETPNLAIEDSDAPLEDQRTDKVVVQKLNINQGRKEGYVIQFDVKVLGPGQSELIGISYEPWSRKKHPRPGKEV